MRMGLFLIFSSIVLDSNSFINETDSCELKDLWKLWPLINIQMSIFIKNPIDALNILLALWHEKLIKAYECYI